MGRYLTEHATSPSCRRSAARCGGASTRSRWCRPTWRTPRTAGRGAPRRWWRATSAHRAAGQKQPRRCTARWPRWRRARPRRRAARLAAARPTPSSIARSSWSSGEARPSCGGYEPRHPRASSRRFETPDAPPLLTPCTATTTSARSCAPRTACGWSTSRASRPSRLAERSALGTPLRDVAAMLRSFDHLAR